MGIATAGLKASKKPDLLVVLFPETCPVSVLFTSNHFKSGSVIYSERALKERGGYARAFVINSGNANCGLGEDGVLNAELMAKRVAENFDITPSEVLVFSTGVIGKPMDMGKVLPAIDHACSNLEELDIKTASEVISTTDSFPKFDFVRDGVVETFGFAKGAGMIHPSMATMLSFVFTNARLDPLTLNKLHTEVNLRTFNSISVDGCMSTNDSFALVSLGLVRDDLERVSRTVEGVSLSLAKKIVEDGEGARHVIKVIVKNASISLKARTIAERIATSNLVKTAIYGNDPNWGRIVASAGSTPFPIDQFKIKVFIGPHLLYDRKPHPRALEKAKRYMEESKEVEITLDLCEGKESWTYYASDLGYEYIRINAEYTT